MAQRTGIPLKTIREAVVGLQGKDILPIAIMELSGLSLEDANFSSDGKGRLYGTLKLEDIDVDDRKMLFRRMK